jgi:hypothetical protein
MVCSLAGCLSALIAGFVTCPFDVIKTRHMTMRMSEKPFNFAEVAKQLYFESGLMGFFRGVHYRCLILSFGGALYFSSFGKYKQLLGVGDM